MDTSRIDKMRRDHENYLKSIGLPKNVAERPRDPESVLKTEILKVDLEIERVSKEIHEMEQLGSNASVIDGRKALLETYRHIQSEKGEDLVRLIAQKKLEQQFGRIPKKAA